MKYFIILILGLIAGFLGAVKLHYLDVSEYLKIVFDSEQISTGALVQEYLRITPVKKIATLEVTTESALTDDYFEDYKLLDYDTPEEVDRFISQIKISGKVKVNAIYGYTTGQIGTGTNPLNWGEPQLLYYEILENNISEVAAGIGISNNALIRRVVNVVLQGLHDKLRAEFATNQVYLNQAKQNAIEKFR